MRFQGAAVKYASWIFGTGTILLALGALAYYLGLFHKGGVSMETCLARSVERFPGKVTWVEYLSTDHERFYEFEVETSAGAVMNVECDASTGEITEFSRHVAPDAPEFAGRVSITLEEARKLALQAKNGRVVSSETYFLNDEEPYYEFDVVTTDGKEFKIEIDGAKGEVASVEDEAWEIGG